DPSEENLANSVWSAARQELSAEDKSKIRSLLEMQRHAMLMYTSCGWFFDDISGLESTQILQYAARAMQIAKEVGGDDLEEEFLNRLASAQSNIPEMENGKTIYNLFVRPAMAIAEKNNV
ncbi:MAG: DUF3536 domain-containing protein, partial [Candidatus Omnitrophica bacterium]|nr:DUF3536 domain-containing protein [Candidatus Omnitrophota bacterium]